jgi:Uncharacterized Fe-S protein
MDWLTESEPRRADPRVLWPEVRSIVMLGMNYGPAEDPLALLADRGAANISVYARHRDYHDVVKGRLKELADWLLAEGRRRGNLRRTRSKVFVDTAPVMEKPLAAAAGLGWQGKHTNLVSRGFGSWLFLGTIFTTFDIEADAPETDRCGSCRACLDACPTAAFPDALSLDARRCISYLTIEHKGPVAEEFRAALGNRIYGCDDCLAVCPWNKFASAAQANSRLLPRAELVAPDLGSLLGLDDAGFRAKFSGSPIKRIGRNRFVRNCLYAAGNSGNGALLPQVEALSADPDPVVADAARWAAARLRASP